MITSDNDMLFEIFPWNENFNVGISIIDEQHQQLILILNKLARHLANRSQPLVLNKIFDELAAYADYHFKTEEKIWAVHFNNDEWFIRHERTHESFITDVLELKKRDHGKPLDEVIYDIVSFLTRWLVYHILDTDKRMANVIEALASGKSMVEAKAFSSEQMTGSMSTLINTVLTMYDSLSNRTMGLMREKSLRKKVEEALVLSEERWKFVLEGGREGVWDWNIENNKTVYSLEHEPLFDGVGNHFLQETHQSRIHPDDIERVKADLQAHLDGETDFYINKHRVLRRNNSYFWVLSRGKVVHRDEQGKALRMVGTHLDITEHELATLIYQQSSQGMFVADVNNSIISVNAAFTQITGYSAEEIMGKTPRYLSSGKHDKAFYRKMWQAIEMTGQWSGEIWNKRKDGSLYPQMLNINTVTDNEGFLNHHVALFTDITEKKKADDIILKQANYDPLTKLANRYLFQQTLQHEVDKSDRSRSTFALLFIDLDHFKDVNDTNGHDVGDCLLIEVAERIKSCIRTTDVVARLGGDEYTVILADLEDPYIIERVTQNIINALQAPFLINEYQIFISASIGITLYPDDAIDIKSMQKHADQAMYKAKEKGRNCYSYFTQSMQNEALIHQKLTDSLRNALKEEQLEVYYQPVVNCVTSEIYKAEALLRWNHPVYGMVSPVDFIPLAEETGLIVGIGDWVFHQVADQLQQWSEKYEIDLQISINKSPVQFRATDNHNHWVDYLLSLGLSGKNIMVEITEGLLLEDDTKLTEQLVNFRNAGVEVAIDDFGTGYSSLSYLRKFDIDYLKIDRSFIQNLATATEDRALSEAIIVMSHKLGMKVIAEGVETEQQLQLLIEAGCDYMQGDFISKPLPSEAFEQFLCQSQH